MSCCPSDRVPALVKSETGSGEFIDLSNGAKVYVTGNKESKNVVLFVADIFGYTTGRHLGICDFFASKGYYVIAPDVYKGSRYVPKDPNDLSLDVVDYIKSHPIDSIQEVLDETYSKVLPSTCEWIGMIGFCAGSWEVFHESKRNVLPKLKCGIHCHPSIQIEGIFGQDVDALAKSIKHPMLLLPTKGDHEVVQKGSYLEKDFNCEIVDFTHQQHGFVSQGDVDGDEAIKQDVLKVMEMSLQFFSKHQ
mmetsp:Transcript_14908/g.16864  ORF Transcript_14908/g.16864 Transcript_14908/m.16864 type:complete len:248 (-) Transcript_14908:158-901(-)